MEQAPYKPSPSAFYSFEKQGDASFFWIACGVCVIHLLAIGLSFLSFHPPLQESRQKIVVKTVKLNPQLPPLTPITSSLPQPIKQEEPLPLPVPPVSPEPAKLEEAKDKSELPIESVQPVIVPPVETQPTPAPEAPKKKEVAKASSHSDSKPQIKPVPEPKPVSKETKKPAVPKQPAPVKKTPPAPPKPPKTSKPTPEEIAAKEAERARQQELIAAQEQAKARQRESLAKAKENIAKIKETSDKINTPKLVNLDQTEIPKQIEKLQIDALPTGTAGSVELSSKEMNYRDEMAYRLQLALKLPEYGEIKIKLTVERSGKVAQVQIVTSESPKNRQYIEKTVPSLIFPAFGNNFAHSSQYTFLITLNNG